MKEIEILIQKIERFVPYLNLIMMAIGSVSPSRFLLYYMFTASVRPKSVKIWVREIEGKKKKKSKEFIYELVLIEDLNDERYHEEFEMGDIANKRNQKSFQGKF